MTDFEDAVLAACAKRNQIDSLVTTNTADFESSGLIVYTVAEFVQQLKEDDHCYIWQTSSFFLKFQQLPKFLTGKLLFAFFFRYNRER